MHAEEEEGEGEEEGEEGGEEVQFYGSTTSR